MKRIEKFGTVSENEHGLVFAGFELNMNNEEGLSMVVLIELIIERLEQTKAELIAKKSTHIYKAKNDPVT